MDGPLILHSATPPPPSQDLNTYTITIYIQY